MTEHHARGVGPEGLASQLMASGALTSDWLPAYRAVPRELFVPDVVWPGQLRGTGQGEAVDRRTDPEAWRAAVYADVSLTTQWDDGDHTGTDRGRSPTCSNSQPSMVFRMLGASDVHGGERVMEVGTGTGWNAALLSERVGARNVVTIEVDASNAAAAHERLDKAGYRPTAVVGDGAAGYAAGGPYDRVLVTASATGIPRAWLGQTRTGGVVVAPYATAYGGEAIVRLTVQPDGSASGPFVHSSAFMRIRQHRYSRLHTREYLGGKPWPADGDKSLSGLSPEAVGDWLPMFVIGLRTKGMFPWAQTYPDGSYTLWLRDKAVSSWATVDYEPGREVFEVYQGGERRLWDEVTDAYAWWESHGRPGFDRFGLTVTPEGSHTPWLDDPDTPILG